MDTEKKRTDLIENDQDGRLVGQHGVRKHHNSNDDTNVHSGEESKQDSSDDLNDNLEGEDYSSDQEDVSDNEWGNSLNGSIYSDDSDDEYGGENFKGNGEVERANVRARQSVEYNWGDDASSRPGPFKEYSRDRRSGRRTENKVADARSDLVNSANRTARVFTWSGDEGDEKEIKNEMNKKVVKKETDRNESRIDDRPNLQETVAAVRYLQESGELIGRLIESANGRNYAERIQNLTNSLAKLSCTYGRTDEKIHYSQLLLDDSVCLYTVFDESFELCDRRMFFMLKLQFAKMRP